MQRLPGQPVVPGAIRVIAPCGDKELADWVCKLRAWNEALRRFRAAHQRGWVFPWDRRDKLQTPSHPGAGSGPRSTASGQVRLGEESCFLTWK